MQQRNFSFSVKTEEDLRLVQEIKKANAKIGKSFSHTIMQALRAYTKESKPNETK